jgi:hypothetical protein
MSGRLVVLLPGYGSIVCMGECKNVNSHEGDILVKVEENLGANLVGNSN